MFGGTTLNVGKSEVMCFKTNSVEEGWSLYAVFYALQKQVANEAAR